MNWVLELECETTDSQKMNEIYSDFSKKLKGGEIVLLNGPMASGKSFFVRQVVGRILGQEVSNSPSYALHHDYSHLKKRIAHWDLFRLENEDELESSGFWDQLNLTEQITFIEWAGKLKEEWLPKGRKYFQLIWQERAGQLILSVYHAT